MRTKVKVLMCCSDLEEFKGGMVTVVKNYLDYPDWKTSQILFVATHTSGSKWKRLLCFAKAYLKIIILLVKKEVDVAHLHMSERGSFYRKAWILKLLKYFHIPVIIHHHGAEFEDFYKKLSARKKIYVGKILERADCNLVLSDFLAEKLKEKAPNATIYVLHNAVSVPGEYNYHPKEAKIVMLGRQGKRKGSYDLLKALVGIRDRLPVETELWMCGDGDVKEVKEQAEKLGLGKMLVYVGWISGKEKERCLKDATIHVLPSYREGFPMSILETMARGIPNISTNIASIPEVIHEGETGYLIKPGDIEQLQKAILVLLKDRQLREEMSRKGYELIRNNFSIVACVNFLEELYMNCMRR